MKGMPIIMGFWLKFITGVLLAHGARGQMVLNPHPFTIKDLGPLVYGLRNAKPIMFKSNGDTHLVQLYSRTTYWRDPIQLLDVNLSQRTIKYGIGSLGATSPNAYAIHPNGVLYFTSSDPGYFCAWDLAKGSLTTIKQLGDKGGQYAILGDDGKVYVGEIVKGTVESYDPATGAWKNYGIMDDPGPPYNRYAYTLGADSRYIYVAMGQSPWYLVVLDKTTGSQSVYWKNEPAVTGVGVYKGMSGGWFVEKDLIVGGTYTKTYYGFAAGKPVQLAKVPPLHGYPIYDTILSDLAQSSQLMGYDLDLTDSVPDSASGGIAEVRYRPVGAPLWNSSRWVLAMDPLPIARLYTGGVTGMFGMTGTYGPVFAYDAVSGAVNPYGRTGYSDYAAVQYANKWAIAGYTGDTVVFDPTRRWTLNSSTAGTANTNPVKLNGDFGKYHYWAVTGQDGNLYIAGKHERDSLGGELGWQNPITNVAGSLRTPFLNYTPRGLTAASSGTKIVMSSNPITAGDGRVFVLDVATKQLSGSWAPLPGVGDVGPIVEVAPGEIIGVAALTGSFTVYRLNVLTGRIVFSNTLPGNAFGGTATSWYDRRLVTGPDGYVWLYVDNNICRINASTGDLQVVVAASPAGNLLFRGKDMFIYGTTNLRMIAAVFK
jgi:hypothetical protein